jgi:hypothetical protein
MSLRSDTHESIYYSLIKPSIPILLSIMKTTQYYWILKVGHLLQDALINSEEINLGNYFVNCGFSMPLVSKMMEYLDRDMPAPYVEEDAPPSCECTPEKEVGVLIS